MHACVHFEALDTELLLIDQKKVEMGFCSCFGRKKGVRLSKDEDKNWEASQTSSVEGGTMLEQRSQSSVSKDYSHAENFAPTFSYRELAAATNGFREESLIGEGGFGPVYKGTLERTGQLVAIKKLDPSGIQGTKEFLVEVLMLSLLRHPNLVNLIGYCAEGEQRLLVYEFLPLGSLEYHLHDRLPDMQPLDWDTRIMIAAGVAKGLDYLHNKADPPVIHRDLKSSNILLGEGFHPKLSDFGLAKFGPSEDKSHVSTRVMGTHGYCAPEYYGTGKLTTKSDVYCYGIVLLELITGRKAMDNTRARGQHSLLEWVRPLLRDRKNLMQIADPQIRGQFSEAALRHALELALICLQDKAQSRPSMKDVVLAINFLESLVPVAAHSTRDGRGRVSSEEGRNENTTGSQGAENTSQQARKLNKDEERKLAVAEAKLWGETWREKMLASMHKVESELHESHAS